MRLFEDIPDGCDIITVYDEVDGMIQLCEVEGIPHINIHSNTGKYSKGILREIKKLEKTYNKCLVILPFDYLVSFYQKHYIVTVIDKKMRLYLIEKEG